MKKSLLNLFLIVLLAATLRLSGLADRPLGFTWDEAALGYNAYSLLQTGRDEHGQFLPIIFRSFGDYKPGLYIYAVAPFIQLLGLTEFVTRLPSAISGTLLVPMIYILCKKLFRNSKLEISISAAFIAAVNPWLIHFSRGAWEANVCLLLTVLAINLYFFRRFTLSGLFFGFTLITYQSAKLITPVILTLIFWVKRFTTPIKQLLLGTLIFSLFAFIVGIGLGTQSGRLRVFSLNSYNRTPNEIATILSTDNTSNLSFIYYLFHSELYQKLRTFSLHYLNHLSPKFLFTSGDWTSLRHSIPFYGYFHLIEVLTILTGLSILIKFSPKNTAVFLLGLLVLLPVPSSMSRDLVSGVRSLPLALPLVILSAIGFAYLAQKKFFGIPIFFAMIFGLIYFADLYVVHAPHYTANQWLSPYKSAINLVSKNDSQYANVTFSDLLGQPYIFVLFHGKVDPKIYQGSATIVPNQYGDVDQVSAFGKYSFGPIYWPARRNDSSTLFVGGEYELPETDLVSDTPVRIGDVKYPDGKIGFRLVGLP